MDKNWKVGRLKDHLGLVLMFVLATAYLKLDPCCCMNEEGLALLRFRDRIQSDPFGALTNWHEDEGELDPCSWRGVECSDGKVVILDLKDLCLGGTLAPEIGYLVHIKAIILRNNTFSGTIPEQLGELKELEVLDLGYNNFIGPLPDKLGNNYSSAILLLENNPLLSASYPEIHEFEILSRSHVDEISATGLSCTTKSTSQKEDPTEDTLQRRFLVSEPPSYLRSQNANRQPPLGPSAPAPQISNPKSAFAPTSAPTSAPVPPTEPSHITPVAEPSPSTTVAQQPKSSKSNLGLVLGLGIGGSAVFIILILGIYCYRRHKVITVKPWATGLSGQLQKAFVTGVPKLKRSELETACEDFSNVIGSSSIGTIYKGTLSSGVEIAVASIASKSAVDWSTNLESQFRKKIRTLSKVNHKNFVNLIGYCEEEVPFTRMMVFEYAPNGTLFEHLHIEESEHLDWGMRLRIAMGMAYCLEHMHQLDPAIPHKNLNSSAITLTEDYAAKVSEFSFWNQISAAETETKAGIEVIETTHKVAPQHNVYSFGVLLFELVTARLPFSVDNGSSLENWASDYVREERPLRQIVDPTLTTFDANQVDEIEGVIRCCVEPNPAHRPKMRDVCERLRGITGIPNDLAAPRISPLWWAELEILSTEAN